MSNDKSTLYLKKGGGLAQWHASGTIFGPPMPVNDLDPGPLWSVSGVVLLVYFDVISVCWLQRCSTFFMCFFLCNEPFEWSFWGNGPVYLGAWLTSHSLYCWLENGATLWDVWQLGDASWASGCTEMLFCHFGVGKLARGRQGNILKQCEVSCLGST